MGLMITGTPAKRNLVELWHRIYGDVHDSAVIADQAVELGEQKPKLKPMLEKAVKLIGSTLELPDITRGGVRSTAQHHFTWLASEKLGESISKTSFDLTPIFEGKPFTMYLVIPPQSLVKLAPLLRLVLHFLTLMLLQRDKPQRSPIRLIVDEAGVIGKLDILQSQMALGRGYGIFIDLIFQDISQLQESYEKGWKSLLGNIRYQSYFGFMSYEDAEVIGRRTGFSPDYLMQMNQNRELMLFVENGVGQIVRKANYLRDTQVFEGRFDPNPFYL